MNLKSKIPLPTIRAHVFPSITEEAVMSDWFKNHLKQKANPQRQQLLETYSQSWGKVSWDNALTIFVQTDAFLSPWNLSWSSQHRDDGRWSDLGRSSIAWGGEGLWNRRQALIPYSHTAFSQSLCFLPCIILSLLLPLPIPVSRTCSPLWARERYNKKLPS